MHSVVSAVYDVKPGELWPRESLEKITADMLQIEINVSSLDTSLSGYQRVSISNISIRSEEINDCWVYGSYRAKVAVSEKK